MLLFFAITVISGTIYPIIYELITSNNLSIGAPFYNSILKPTAIATLLICFFTHVLIFHYSLKQTLILGSIASIITVIIYLLFNIINIIALAILLCAMMLLLVCIKNIIDNKKIAMNFAHLGISLMAISLTINAYTSLDYNGYIKKGESITLGNYDFSAARYIL